MKRKTSDFYNLTTENLKLTQQKQSQGEKMKLVFFLVLLKDEGMAKEDLNTIN